MLNSQYNSFDINDKELDEIIANAYNLKPSVADKHIEFEEALLLNKSYEFKASNINIDDIFGSFSTKNLTKNAKTERNSYNTLADVCLFIT